MNNYSKHNSQPPEKSPASLIYGIRPIIEAITAGKEFEKILLQHGLKGDLVHELITLIRGNKIPVQTVPIEKLNRTVHGNHQGVVGFVSEITYQPIENILISAFESGKVPFFLVLDRITDVRNLGAIARTAECAGANALIVPSRGSALLTADAIKTSAGALHKIPVHRTENLKETLRYLKSSGVTIFSATEKGEMNYYEADFKQPFAIVMGSEEDGVSEEYLKLSDHKIRIPMYGQIASLNVSVSAGILLYEALRQRSIS
jgi:23S rRNA (guanosine2251-2'-O)-methyltransferase